MALALFFVATDADAQLSTEPSELARIELRNDASCQGNIVYLRDIATLTGSKALCDRLGGVMISPSPVAGQSNRWTRQDILKQLQWRNIPSTQFRLTGADSCQVTRTSLKTASEGNVEFTPVQNTPVSGTQAERNVAQAIKNFIQNKTGDAVQRSVHLQVPTKHIKTLAHSKSIVGVAGGESPYDGLQHFLLLVKTPHGEESIDVEASVQLPAMVVVSKGPMRRGQVIVEADLQTGSLPLNFKSSLGDCFQSPHELVGKEIRRAVSSGQPVTRADVGPARVIDTNDLVQVEIQAGGITVQTTAKCLQPGGLGDLIQVELIPHRKRVVGEIIGEQTVRIIQASGAG